MKRELEEALFKDFPNLYKNHQRCFECGDGWEGIIRELSAKLEALVLQIPEEDRRDFRVACVKEKFAELRFDCDFPYRYDHFLVERFNVHISEAENKSETVCETCGQPGTQRSNKVWIRVTCDSCEDKRSKK